MNKSKYKLLRNGILFDLIGMLSLFIPFVGPFLDIIWAPIAAKKMNDMDSGTSGTMASIAVFIEELLPGADFIPTFTLLWLYTFVWKKQKQPTPRTIEVKVND
jgi:hypothetical protein